MTSLRVRWWGAMAVALIGGLCFGLATSAGLRAALSFVGGLALVVAAFEFGAFNIRFAGRYLPNLTLVVALLSYATTAIAFGLVLAASSPRVVYPWGISAGLFSGLVLWVGTELIRTRVDR